MSECRYESWYICKHFYLPSHLIRFPTYKKSYTCTTHLLVYNILYISLLILNSFAPQICSCVIKVNNEGLVSIWNNWWETFDIRYIIYYIINIMNTVYTVSTWNFQGLAARTTWIRERSVRVEARCSGLAIRRDVLA